MHALQCQIKVRKRQASALQKMRKRKAKAAKEGQEEELIKVVNFFLKTIW